MKLLALAFAALASPAIAADCDPEDWTGRWDTVYGWVELETEGSAVTGNYEFANGTLEGALDPTSCILTGAWNQNDLDKGSFEFTLTPSGNAWRGQWVSSETGMSDDWNGIRASGG